MQLGYKVQNGQTIYDLALSLYGDLSYIFKLIADNPGITNVDFDFDSSPGMILLYDPTLKKPFPRPLSRILSAPPAVTSIVAEFGQTLYDICLMSYGSLDFIVKLCKDNNIGSVNTGDIQGKTFTFDNTLVNNNSFFAFLQETGYVIATSDSEQSNLSRRSFNISFNISFD